MKWVTVNDMYKSSKGDNTPLLSQYSADFWADYRTNYEKYDKLFNRMFMSFRYFMQQPVSMCDDITQEHIDEITAEFINDVYNHLMINDKKYKELYRINVVDDETYSIVDNYNVVETLEKETTKTDSDVYGARTDNTTENIGQRIDSGSQSIGARTDSNETVIGEQNNTGTNTIAGFNSLDFENDSEVLDSIGERTDTSETNIGAQSNTSSNTIGAQSNTTGFSKGSQTDNHTGSGTEEYTLTRKGNIGVKTATEIMAEHKDFWSLWDFYNFIFKEICSELLLI